MQGPPEHRHGEWDVGWDIPLVQSFSTLALLTLGAGFVVRSCPSCCRMFSSILASTYWTPAAFCLVVTIKTVSRCSQVLPIGQNLPQLKVLSHSKGGTSLCLSCCHSNLTLTILDTNVVLFFVTKRFYKLDPNLL